MSAKRGRKRASRPTPARSRRATVTLPDGTVAVIKSAPKPRQRETDGDVPGTWSLIKALLVMPEAYRMFDDVPREPGQYGGGPRTWPNEMFSALFCLRFVYPEMRALMRELSDDPHRLELLIESVTANITDPHARAKFVQATTVRRLPNRSTVSRYVNSYFSADRGAAALRETGLLLARIRGHFNAQRARNSANPDIRDVIYSDGTVLKPPSTETYSTAVNRQTGEIWHPKVDTGSRLHSQGSATEPIVNGTKITTLLTRGDAYNSEIFLGLCHTSQPDPAAEATDAINRVAEIRADMATGPEPLAARVLVYDGAATSEHHRKLASLGILLMNRPPAKRSTTDPDTGAKIRLEEHMGDLGRWWHKQGHQHHPQCPGHNLTGIGGDIHLQEPVNGKIEYRKLDHQPRAITRRGKTYNYERVNVPCHRQRRTAPIDIPWHQAPGETDNAYQTRLRYSRPWGPTSPTGTRLRGIRSSVENRFCMIDRMFPFKRVPAYSVQTKLSLMFGYAIGHNLAKAGLERIRAGP